ncbi:restriction endonuclease subunit S [Tenacibaculum singaporense]|uniref:restriction endonuclease subunit S n=1 Tax=Tenacibaculum singaporense TaxID=2358479 RepID=UPI0035194DD7
MKRYETYKDSGVEWLGKIPEHWESAKIKFIANVFNGNSLNDKLKEKYRKTSSDCIPYIGSKDIEAETNIINYNNGIRISKEDESNFKLAKEGSAVICIEGGSAGKKIGFIENDTFFVNKLACLNSGNKFMYYFIQSSLFKNQFNSNLSGLIAGVSISSLKNLFITTPPPEEQTQIANYLNHKTEQLDSLIAKKEQLIKLLEEERKAIINQAVTKGINPNVPMKDSGIEWLGEIPEHWKIPKIWHLVLMQKLEIQDGNHGSLYPKQEDFRTEGVYFIKPRDIRNGSVNFETCDCLTIEHAASLRIGFTKPNDLLLVNRGGTIGRMARIKNIPNNLDYVIINPQMTYIRCNKGLDSDFTYYQCLSDIFQESLEQVKAFGSTFSFLGLSNMGNFPFILPPINEQKKISQFINQKIGDLDDTIDKVNKELVFLKEYKTALISEVVTGKIDVREEILN